MESEVHEYQEYPALTVENGKDLINESNKLSLVYSAWSAVVFVILASILSLWESWSSLAEVWSQRAAYSHGYVIALVSIGLILRLRTTLRAEQPQPQITSVWLLAVLLLGWMIMRLSGIQIGELLLLPLILLSTIYAVAGWHVSKQLIFPLFFLYFAIPIWHSGNFILQWITVQAVEELIRAAGFLAYIEGNYVFLSSGTFEIADGCSGIGFFISAIAISTLYSYLYLQSHYRRFMLVLIGTALGIVMNWLRIFIIIYAGYKTDMQHYLVTVDHSNFGWVIFALMLVPFFIIARRLEMAEVNIPEINEDAVRDRSNNNSQAGIPCYVPVLVVTTIMLLGAAAYEKFRAMPIEVASVSICTPVSSQTWVHGAGVQVDWSPVYIGPREELIAGYNNGSHTVTAYINMYVGQSQGAELIGYENHIEGSGIWKQTKSTIKDIEISSNDTLRVREIILESNNGKKRVVYYWYQVGGHRIVRDIQAKLYQGFLQLASSPYSGIAAISAACSRNDCEAAHQDLRSWIVEQWSTQGPELKFWSKQCG